MGRRELGRAAEAALLAVVDAGKDLKPGQGDSPAGRRSGFGPWSRADGVVSADSSTSARRSLQSVIPGRAAP